MAQFFVGRDTLVCDAYDIKSQKQFINTLYANIRFRGAMTTVNPNRDSPNGYPTVTPTELQPVTLSH